MTAIPLKASLLASAFLLAFSSLVNGAFASDFEAEIGGEILEIRTFSTHTEIKDAEQNTFIISATPNGIVELEKIGPDGVYTTTLYDTADIHPTLQEQAQYDQIMQGSVITEAGGSESLYPSSSLNLEQDGSASIQSWACVGATVNLAAAAGGVALGCGGAQAALACGVALSNYVAASINYWEACTHN